MLPLEAVPNVSEGRDRAVIDAIVAAFSEGVRLLDVHTDPDHHRSVITVSGDDATLVDALVGGVREAKARIDLRVHDGVHPRIGAADVVPIVPLRHADMGRAVDVALAVAERIAGELGLPVFLYGEAGDGRRPAQYRLGGPVELQRRIDLGELVPDRGPARLDAAAGGVIVGARPPLIAFNVALRTESLDIGRAIAAVLRESGGGLPGVRALGLALPRAGHVQVSLNVEDVEAAPLHEVVARIEAEALKHGVEVGDAELVGLLPSSVAFAAAAGALRIPGLDVGRSLELRALGVIADGPPA